MVAATATVRPSRRRWRGRVAARVLGVGASVLQRLPDRGLHRIADAVGRVLYSAQRDRRRLVKRNLGHVCAWLADAGLANTRVAGAARDERALDRLVREAFGHYVRSYLEGAIAPVYGRPAARARVVADRPALVDEMLGPTGSGRRPAIVVGLHFGGMEIPAIHATSERRLEMVTPMETVDDPDLQAYFVRTRGSTGLRIIPTRGAARELTAWLASGRPVAIVADRVVAGTGTRVELFGRSARLPLGPAALAVETDTPLWVVAARRTGWGDYRVRIERVPLPPEGSRRARLGAMLAEQARAFERAIAEAPEQWWTLFFPIWEDG